TSLEQVLLASPSDRRSLWCGADGALVLEQPLQHADGGMERRARALRGFAVPTAVIELLADKTARQALGRAAEVGAEGERAPVDPRLHLPLEERFLAKLLVPPEARSKARHRGVHGWIVAIDAGCAQEEHREQGRQPDGGTGSVP